MCFLCQSIQEKERRKEEAKERKELAEHKKLITAIKVMLINLRQASINIQDCFLCKFTPLTLKTLIKDRNLQELIYILIFGDFFITKKCFSHRVGGSGWPVQLTKDMTLSCLQMQSFTTLVEPRFTLTPKTLCIGLFCSCILSTLRRTIQRTSMKTTRKIF